jgi:hypothetical protein
MGLGIIECHESRKATVKGEANGFKFYHEPFSYVNARFNINDFRMNYDEFLLKIESMFTVLHYLNQRPTGAYHVKLILEHINEHGRNKFNVRQMFFTVRKFQYNPTLIVIKRRDYVLTAFGTYEKKGDYPAALNAARKTVNTFHNFKELFCLLEERITNDDYGYMNEAIVSGYKSNNLMIYAMIRKFNLLCTGRQRGGVEYLRKVLKREALYSISIKGLTANEKLFLKNRSIVKQMFLVLKDITGLDTDIKIVPKDRVQNKLKTELMNLINKTSNLDCIAGAKDFNQIYKNYPTKHLPLLTDLTNVFETDLKNSIFNQVTIEEAYLRGEVFWSEFNKFHNVTLEKGTMNFGIVFTSS